MKSSCTLNASLSLVLLTPIAGCGTQFLSDRTTNPVIYNSDSSIGNDKVGILSTTAGRRAIVVIYTPTGTKVRAGPPPDAIAALAHSVETNLAANVGNGQGGTAAFQAAAALSASPALYRTQGLQLWREEAFNLCIQLAEGNIQKPEYDSRLATATTESIDLIKAEMPAVLVAAAKAGTTTVAPELGQAIKASVDKTSGTATTDNQGANATTPPANSGAANPIGGAKAADGVAGTGK